MTKKTFKVGDHVRVIRCANTSSPKTGQDYGTTFIIHDVNTTGSEQCCYPKGRVGVYSSYLELVVDELYQIF